MEEQHSTFIQIPIIADICKKKCCSISIITLRDCKAVTINKSQVVTIGPHQLFEKSNCIFAKFW